MKKSTCKNPNAEATKKQTFAIFCISKTDVRKYKLTRQQASDIISSLNDKGEAKLPDDSVLLSKNGKKKAVVKWDKEVKPYSVKKSSRKESSWALDLIRKAEAAGADAMQDLIDSKEVVPMVVQQHENMMDDNSPVEKQWVVPGGPCGFANIRVKCVNGPSRKFINQLKKAGLAGDRNSFKDWSKSDYYGGYMKSFTMIGGQSLAYKEAYAYAYAGVLDAAGINTWVWSRMD